jgi:cation:H+ antiporter
MEIFLFLVCFIGGLVLLISCSNLLVTGASSVALKLKVSPLLIGLTIVALGTSLPELAISFVGAINSSISNTSADISLGNIIGSNIANIALVLGIGLLITTINPKKSVTYIDLFFLFLSIAFFVVFLLFFGVGNEKGINRIESVFLLIILIAFIVVVFKNKKKTSENTEVSPETKIISTSKSIVFIIIGLAGVVLGGLVTNYGAENLAVIVLNRGFSMEITKAKTLVGLSVVAVGTSLPELVTTVVALRKKEEALSLGNIIGSNIINTLFIVGLSGSIFPLVANSEIIFDALICFALTGLFIILVVVREKLGKFTGIAFLLIYFSYLTFIILRALEIFSF